jgi:ubiquinone/menaquinone biosynthesis C-methylase UbiE
MHLETACPVTRWQAFFTDEPELALVPHSKCADRAGRVFMEHRVEKVLDLGCGTGRESRRLAEFVPTVVSLDYSAAGLGLAKEKGSKGLVRSDARRLPFQDSAFGAVYCYGLLHEFCGTGSAGKVQSVMAEARRVLEPEGLLVLAVLAGDPIKGDPEIPNVQLFSDTMFFDAATGFDCMEYREYDDMSCAGNPQYNIHCGLFRKSGNPGSKQEN